MRCDTSAHAYQATFCHKSDWSEPFPPGSEILQYWQSLARKHGVYETAKLRHKVEAADWDAGSCQWSLAVRNLDKDCSATEVFDFVITCAGRLNAWKLPDYPGVADYKGVLRHTWNWDTSFDCEGKTVAVIGNGASGVQVIPSLQKAVSHLHHFVRSKTWVGPTASDAASSEAAEPSQLADELRKAPDSLAEYVAFRKHIEDKTWRGFRSFIRHSDENRSLRDRFTAAIRKQLKARPDILEDFIPLFAPNCRRQTQGPGYLEAITAANVTYVTTPIARFTASGIQTQDGIVREVDAIFCATGSETNYPLQFDVRARGQELRDLWAPDGEPGFPYTYLGMATPGFPNLLFLHGPYGVSPSGTVPYIFETQLTYMARLLRKASREGIKSVEALPEAANDFAAYSDAFFASTVLTDGCNSSFNGGRAGSRIHGFWPGSAAHLAIIRREPRWEDWAYQYLAPSGNRFSWYFGNGMSRREGDSSYDMTAYLRNDEEVDLRGVHESWWQIP